METDGQLICMSNVPEKDNPHLRRLTDPLIAKKMDGYMEMIPAGFEWDGSSVPYLFQGLFPRHRHPVASSRHDWRCRRAKTRAERRWADEEFRGDVGKTSWWITKQFGYAGVRMGALFGIGCHYDQT